MKLSLNMKSVEVLRSFAQRMTAAIEDISVNTESLFAAYNSVSDSVGPHEHYFLELLQSIKKSQEISAYALKELPIMLNSTAEKMESYIKYGATEGRMLVNMPDVSMKYSLYAPSAELKSESASTNTFIKELYDRNKDGVRIDDYEFEQTPHYNSNTRGIKLHAQADLHNPTGKMSTYFHEVGHFIDHVGGTGGVWLSSDPEYKKLLQEDAKNHIDKTMLLFSCDLQGAYEIISEEVSGFWNAGVSDIFGSLTGCRCQGEWGHAPDYWARDESRVAKEAVANMFEASFGSEGGGTRKAETMKKFFPKSYEYFEKIVKEQLT